MCYCCGRYVPNVTHCVPNVKREETSTIIVQSVYIIVMAKDVLKVVKTASTLMKNWRNASLVTVHAGNCLLVCSMRLEQCVYSYYYKILQLFVLPLFDWCLVTSDICMSRLSLVTKYQWFVSPWFDWNSVTSDICMCHLSLNISDLSCHGLIKIQWQVTSVCVTYH